MDYGANLAQMRRNWEKGLRWFGYLPFPYWMERDPLRRTYKDKKLLRKYGKVTYAALVQANVQMFYPVNGQNIPGNPGCVLYSFSENCENAPEHMLELGEYLFSYKDRDDAPDCIRHIVGAITDEHSRSMNQKLDPCVTNGDEIVFTTIMFFRQHLPKNRLIGSVFPVVVAPGHCESVMVLPKRYWTKEMKMNYIQW